MRFRPRDATRRSGPKAESTRGWHRRHRAGPARERTSAGRAKPPGRVARLGPCFLRRSACREYPRGGLTSSAARVYGHVVNERSTVTQHIAGSADTKALGRGTAVAQMPDCRATAAPGPSPGGRRVSSVELGSCLRAPLLTDRSTEPARPETAGTTGREEASQGERLQFFGAGFPLPEAGGLGALFLGG